MKKMKSVAPKMKTTTSDMPKGKIPAAKKPNPFASKVAAKVKKSKMPY